MPDNAQVTLLADRGFQRGALIRWLRQQGWSWYLRAKSDLQMTLALGKQASVGQLLPQSGQVNLFHQFTLLRNISAHLAIANSPTADESWAVITDAPPSLQTFALIRSHLRHAHALICVLTLLATAHLLALYLGFLLTHQGQRYQVDWHAQWGLSFLQLGLRQLQRLCYQNLPLPLLKPLPLINPPPASASLRKQATLAYRLEFE